MPFEPKCPHEFKFSQPQPPRGQLCSLPFFLKVLSFQRGLLYRELGTVAPFILFPHTDPSDFVLFVRPPDSSLHSALPWDIQRSTGIPSLERSLESGSLEQGL